MSPPIPPESLPPLCKWQISAEGIPIGPHDEEWLIDAIERGELLKGLARPAGDPHWRELKAHPRFADALRRAASTISFQARNSSHGKLKKSGLAR